MGVSQKCSVTDTIRIILTQLVGFISRLSTKLNAHNANCSPAYSCVGEPILYVYVLSIQKKTKVLFFKKFNSVNLKAHKFKTYLISLEQVTRQNFWPKTIYDCANAMYINLGLPVYRGNT